MSQGNSDFIYEYEVARCPITEEQAEQVIRWLGIDPKRIKEYCGISTSRAGLIRLASSMKHDLYPPEYISPCENTGR